MVIDETVGSSDQSPAEPDATGLASGADAPLAAEEAPAKSEAEDGIADKEPVETGRDDVPAPTVDSEAPTGQEEQVDDDDDDDDNDEYVGDVEPLELIVDDESGDEESARDWYILKVQVNREKTICEALQRRVKMEGLERYFGDIIVPTEDIVEFTKSGKKRVVKKKIYPGYIVVHMVINDDTWFIVRETPGIGDFTGSAGKPSPMLPHEVDRIVKKPGDDEDDGPAKIAIPFKTGDRVRVKEGYFQNFEGDVESIDEANGHITVMINIFGRSTPVELEHWQVETV